MFKKYVRGLYDLLKLIIGLAIYLVCKKTVPFSYQAMINIFCLTKGHSNDFLSKIIGAVNKPCRFSEEEGLLGRLDAIKRSQISHKLNQDGYYIFDRKLAPDVCSRLLEFATKTQSYMSSKAEPRKPILAKYQRDLPKAVRYDFGTSDLLNNSDIQNLLADTSFATVAQDYFRARPVLDILGMWWSTSLSDKPDTGAAQYYHFDMDRIKWIKFFIYLTDVTPANGPHSFVSGSHKSGAIPASILDKGYARLSDEEVRNEYDESNIIEFNGLRGTIIAEDTRGLHKGKHVQQDDRLILQFQFSNSLFGGYYPKNTLDDNLTETLALKVKQFPELYKAYL